MKPQLIGPPPDPCQNYTRADAAKYLRVSMAHLSNLVRGKVQGAPRLRCARMGRRMLFKRQWLDEFMDALS
jgi:excisionase family DNA binding protein